MSENISSHIPGIEKTPTDPEFGKARVDAAGLPRHFEQGNQQARDQIRENMLAGEELQHRARNTMALVRSAFKRTIATGKSLDDVEMHFCGRLDVLAHYMLPHSGQWDATVDVESIILHELRNFELGDTSGIILQGFDAALSLEQAQSFALAIHELTTNSLKYGALSMRNAALSVTWERHNSWLKLIWAETGVPIVTSTPVLRGFGREFIEDALPYQIGATTHFELKPGGVVCSIELQLMPPRVDDIL